MNKKIKMLIILSTMIISLSGCNNNGNNVDKEMQDRASEIESKMSESNGNYSDSNGVIDQDRSKEGSLEEDLEENLQETMDDYNSVPTMANLNVAQLEKLDNTKRGWGQGKNKNANNQPVDAIDFQNKYGNRNAFFIRDLDQKKIYLTFDEGYENGYTSKILDVLRDKNVSAVFFVTMPYVKSNSDLINRMINEGHIVGNHSVKHKSFPTISIEEGKEEVEGLHNYVRENYNYDMKLFRFPCGEFSERSLELLNQLGYKSIFWSYAYCDWDPQKQMSPVEAKEKLLSSAHNGAIYLLHAVSKTNTEILGEVIDQLRKDGYEIAKFE